MKYCTRCGKPIDESAIFCTECGAMQGAPMAKTRTYGKEDLAPHGGFAFLCFLFPIVGLILWFYWKDTKPGRASSAAKGSLANICFGSPILGVILWAVWKQTYPDFAKVCVISAIAGAIFSAVIYGIYFILILTGNIAEDFYLFEEMIFAFIHR